MINKKYFSFKNISATIIGCFILFWIIYTQVKIEHLNKNYKLASAQTTHVSPPPSKSNYRQLDYEFFVNGKKYTGSASAGNCEDYKLTDLSWLLVNRTFKVAYDSSDPTVSTLISNERAAKKFNQSVNDTILHFDSIINCLKVFGQY